MNINKIIQNEIFSLLNESMYKLSDFKIKTSSDDIHSVAEANDLTVSISYENVPIYELSGGVNIYDNNERNRINKLKEMILSNRFISRLIIDGNNNVIEGQHRFQALSELNFDYVPVVRLKGIDDYIKNRDEISNILRENGVLNSDHRYYIISNISKIISDEKGNVNSLMDYIPPKGYEKAWNLAITKIIQTNN